MPAEKVGQKYEKNLRRVWMEALLIIIVHITTINADMNLFLKKWKKLINCHWNSKNTVCECQNFVSHKPNSENCKATNVEIKINQR